MSDTEPTYKTLPYRFSLRTNRGRSNSRRRWLAGYAPLFIPSASENLLVAKACRNSPVCSSAIPG